MRPAAVAVELRAPGPLDVRATLGALAHGPGDPCQRATADGVWRATRTPEGPATVQVDDGAARPHHAGGVMRVRAWGPGARWMADRAAELVGLADDVGAFEPLDRVVAEAWHRHRGHRFGRTGRLSEALVPVILGQKVQATAAHRSWRRIVWAFGEPAPAVDAGAPDGLRLPPTPRRLAELDYSAFHRFDVERKRADAIRTVGRRAASIDALAERRSGAEVRAALESLPGIGPWTSAVATQMAIGDPDAVVVGDFHLPNSVAWALAGEPRADDARMLELLAPYDGQRARVQRLVKAGGHGAPRRGPRLEVISFADR